MLETRTRCSHLTQIKRWKNRLQVYPRLNTIYHTELYRIVRKACMKRSLRTLVKPGFLDFLSQLWKVKYYSVRSKPPELEIAWATISDTCSIEIRANKSPKLKEEEEVEA